MAKSQVDKFQRVEIGGDIAVIASLLSVKHFNPSWPVQSSGFDTKTERSPGSECARIYLNGHIAKVQTGRNIFMVITTNVFVGIAEVIWNLCAMIVMAKVHCITLLGELCLILRLPTHYRGRVQPVATI